MGVTIRLFVFDRFRATPPVACTLRENREKQTKVGHRPLEAGLPDVPRGLRVEDPVPVPRTDLYSARPESQDMCGNSFFTPQPELESRFDVDVPDGVEYHPPYNIAPGSHLEAVTNTDPDELA